MAVNDNIVMVCVSKMNMEERSTGNGTHHRQKTPPRPKSLHGTVFSGTAITIVNFIVIQGADGLNVHPRHRVAADFADW